MDPSKESTLTCSAWNALIHHPAEEEENSSELPSTVDMDAIKGAPDTPLIGTPGPWSVGEPSSAEKMIDNNASSSDEEDDGDSDASSRSSSASDSEVGIKLTKPVSNKLMKEIVVVE